MWGQFKLLQTDKKTHYLADYSCTLTSLWGKPAAENMGIFWPRAMLK